MATDQPPTQPQPYGEVFDRGYQHYTGERLGRSYAVRRLIIFSIRGGLGIKKRWTAKILPAIDRSLHAVTGQCRHEPLAVAINPY